MPVAVLVQPRFANTFRNRLPFSHDLPDKRHRIAEIAGLNINDHLPVLQWSFAYPSYKNEGNGQSTCDAIPPPETRPANDPVFHFFPGSRPVP